MRASRLLFVGSGVAIAVACGGGSSSSDTGGAPPVEQPPGTPPPPGVIPPPSMAVGDPCRGAPVPPEQAHVADGMCARLVVNGGVGKIRQITFAPDGVMFVASNDGKIYRMKDEDGDGFYAATEIESYATFSGGNGNNLDIDVSNGFLYAGTADGVKRWPWSPTATDGGAAQDVIKDAPSGGSHPLHTVRISDGFLYVHSGSAANASLNSVGAAPGDYDDNRSLVRRFPLASLTGAPVPWLSGEIVTQGLRNCVGIGRTAKGRLFGVVNGLDDVVHGGVNVHDDNPGEQLVEIAMGKKYGYPYCFTAQRIVENGTLIPAGTQLWNQNFGQHDDAWCATNSSPPATFIQAHSAPLDIVFFDAQPTGALPEKYRGGAFVALHGSWDRSPATGYKVIWMPFDASGNPTMPTSTADATTFPYETVFGGGNAAAAQDGPWAWQSDAYSDSPRFSGVAISPVDGALYAVSDNAGTIYRIGLPKSP